jgi:uncharacterized protein
MSELAATATAAATVSVPAPERDVVATIARLRIYPVKSLGGIECKSAVLDVTGLQWDRHWMVVDAEGVFLSQRELARMALVQPELRESSLALQAPGMTALEIPFLASGEARRVEVWDDTVAALDVGDAAALWLQKSLGTQGLRLVRFDPYVQRACSRKWTQGLAAHTQFADGYPVLVCTSAALDGLNAQLAARGEAAVGIERFRPNIVLEGAPAHDEDHWSDLDVLDAKHRVLAGLRMVKPCARCPIPDIDPATAASHPAVGDTLAAYRQDARVNGAVTFGMNAIVTQGAGAVLQVGQRAQASYAFG